MLSGDHSQGAPTTTSNSLHAPGALRSHRSIVAPAPPLTEEEQEQQQQQQQLLSHPHRQSGSSGSASSLLQAKQQQQQQQQRSIEGASVDELSSLSGLQLNSAGDNTTASGGDGNNVASICAASAKRLVNLEMQMQELFRQQKLVLENQAQMTQQMTLMQQQSQQQQGGFPYFGGGMSDGGRQSIFCGGGGGAGRASVFSTVSSNGGGGGAHRQSVFCGSQTNSIGRHKSLVARVGQTRQRVRVGNSGKNSVATAASEAARHGVLGSIFGNAAFQSTSSLQSVLSQQHNSAGRNVSLSYTPASPQNGVATGLATFGDGAGGVPTKSSVASSSSSAAKKAKKARMSVAFALGTDQENQSDDSDTTRKESVFAASGGATTTQTSQDRTSPAPLRPLQKPDGDPINKSGAPDSPFKLANTLEPNQGLIPADKSTTSSGAGAPGGAAHSSSTNTYGSSINSYSNPHSGRGPGSREVSQSMEGSDTSQMSAIIKKRGGKGGKQRKSLKSITKKLEHTRKLARMSVVSRADAGGVFSNDTLNGSLLSILPHDLHAQTRLACPDLADSFVSGDEQQPVSAFSLINEEGNPHAASSTKSGSSAAATRPLAASQSANSNSPSSSGIFNPLQKSSNWSSNPMGLSTKPRNHPNLAASGSTRSGPGFEANSNDASAIARRRQTQKKSVMMGQLISASQQADNIVASFGAEHWLATFVDILYIALSTVVMFVALTRFAWMGDPVSTLTMSLNVIISALTIIFVVVKSRTRNRVNQWEVVDDIAALRKMYFKSVWFGVDLLTIVPIEFIFIGWAHLGYILCMLRHLLRVPRMLTLYRSTHPLTSARQWFVIGFIFSMSALLIETAALIFFAVEPTSPDPYDAFYWTVTTLTSVGYGDIVPTSRDSKYLSMAVQVCGIMIISAITSVATQFLTATDPIDEDIQRRKKMMYSMLRFYDIPWEVQKEVIALFPSILADHNEDQFNELAQDLPKAVGQKIEVFLRRKLISQVPLLRDLGDKTLLLEIASVLTSAMYQPGDYIMQAGDEGREMYFIASGGVDVLVPLDEELEAVVAVLRTGQWFGEIALLEHTVRTASVQATEECELLVLGQEAFHNVAARYQKLLSVLQEEASIRKHQDEHLCDEDDEDGDDEEDQEGDDSDMVGPQQQRPHFGQQLDDEDEVRRSTEKSASNLNNTSTSLGSDHAPPLSGGGGGALNNEKLTDLFGEGDSRHGSHVLSVASMSTADENNNMPGGLLSGNSRYTPPVGFGGAYSAGSSPRHVPPATGGGGSANSSHNNGETTVTTNTNRSGDEGFFSLVDK